MDTIDVAGADELDFASDRRSKHQHTQIKIVAEVPTSALRGPTQAKCTMVLGLSNEIWSLALPYMIIPDEGATGGNVAFVFFPISVLGCIFVFSYYPKTEGRSFEEIDALYTRGTRPRDFAKTRLE